MNSLIYSSTILSIIFSLCMNQGFNLESKSLTPNADIDERFTPQGLDYNPEITWNSSPSNSKSFAFLVEDPDAPRGTWYHWVVKNIPSTVNKISENSNPGEEIVNSWKLKRYKGPSPPKGQRHRYFFKLYALSVERINANNVETFLEQVEKFKIGESSIMGFYSKDQVNKDF